MTKYLVLIFVIVTGTLIGLGSYLINKYGSTNLELGKTTLAYTQSVQASKRDKEVLNYIESIRDEVKDKSNSELDDMLSDLVPMRSSADY